MLTEGDIEVNRLYDLNQEKAVANAETAKARIRQHYLIPAEKAGFRILSVKVDPVVDSVEIRGNLATVRLHATVTYETVYDQTDEPVTTVEADIPYELKLIQRNGAWLLTELVSLDTYSKRANGSATKLQAGDSIF